VVQGVDEAWTGELETG
jgi:hypothetical protein